MMIFGNLNLEMIKVEPNLTLVLIFIFYWAIVYFLFTFIMGLYIDNYRRNLLDLGYMNSSYTKTWGIKGKLFFFHYKIMSKIILNGFSFGCQKNV